ncbi:flavin reductase family protein [Streptomyces sp. NPDC056222]|uniref:flavin reductase family protein n=1 Tax=Streptomyces sp. NPDC056222 TaxID=3345749 RepID=UPI0035E24CF5
MTGLDVFTDVLDHPVYVVTAAAGDGERAGCLVGFASQCSIEPARFTVWLSRNNHTYLVACRSSHLAVHVLRRAQIETARLFGEETGDEVDKFTRVTWRTGPGGAPVLADARAWFVGRVEERWDGGDHVGFLLTPVAVGASEPDKATDAEDGTQPEAEGVADPEGSVRPEGAGRPALLRLSDVSDFSPGHPA